jgi:hypothetical protein
VTDFVRKTVGWFALPVAFLVCIPMSAFIFLNYWSQDKFSRDFGVYWRAANQPVSEVYFWQGAFPFPYAPTMLLWIEPLAYIPRWPAYFAFVAISVAALVWVCRKHLSKRAIALVLATPPVCRGLFTGQVSALLSAILIWSCETGNRIAAGIALGIIASIKPQLVVMAPLMLLFARDWRAFVSAGSTFLVMVALSILVFGPARWPEWVASMDHFHSAVADSSVINVSITPAALAERFGYPPLPFLLLGTLAGAGLVYLCRNSEPFQKAAAIGAGSLLASPYALAYDLVAVIPFLAMLIAQGRLLPLIGLGALYLPLAVPAAAVSMLPKLARRPVLRQA